MKPLGRQRRFRLLRTFDPTQREIYFATIFLGILLGVGTLGYVLIEGWQWEEGLYMTFITLTTIGFGEVKALSTLGRFFTIALGLVGIGSVAFIATRFAQLLLNSNRLYERRMAHHIKRMRDHYILCGFGRIGRRIAQDLANSQTPFVVIELDEAKATTLKRTNCPHKHGNAEDEEILVQAGIHHAKGLILTLPDDSTNVFVTLTARELNPSLYILVRTEVHQNRKKLLRAGADKVVAPYEIGADRMAQVILRPHVDLFMEEVLKTGALNMQMEEVIVQPGSLLDGRSLAECQFRQIFDAIVIALVSPEGEQMRFNPKPTHQIKAGDVLIVLGSKEMITRLRVEGCQPR